VGLAGPHGVTMPGHLVSRAREQELLGEEDVD
jgi:hypothetical protein